ncbi:hypothetical protein COCC4DRAFT_143506 [Bipolaris maydis ATCC 48331]|uniref:Uncharacterized protein n=2 Tax=Cochliobolus heterostrophus TaxID=5016 RepID=M2UFA4_COCH5|nr:uncharacterized protein COCC4DRAFT_143506 [Bipolaris maydis ATCC 48331]EMD86592.1 hypothetical protein COCHEDRAFT_1115297 [Bipolaris maydis C5]KAJ5051172.1 hypothetical protein J3E74DRAFT_229844 [Bipolaris maydis]ENI03005.1 hypothetical protein COCC4DRAFT_143506 [Bipolaris maydis ATCC 48331]KAJ5052656.1 hypothetical protein J3E74DRAFT_412154 [Bipolaris maydis]KAJ6192325.1 hypothetical protein J3E72DRAFT_204334 [Bipolaris maydis]
MSEALQHLQAMLKPPHSLVPTVADTSHIQRLFHKWEKEARGKGLSYSSWLALMTATVIGASSEASMTALYHHATASMDLKDSIVIAEFMREIGLKGIAVVSLPQIMDMLDEFRASLPSAVISSLNTRSSSFANSDNINSIKEQGEKLWNAIHHPNGGKIERRLANAHPDLGNYIRYHVYGGLLSRDYAVTVGRITISLCAIACLRASRPFSRQLAGHVHALKKTWNDGSWISDPNAGSQEGVRWLTSDEGCIWVLEVVDDLVLAIKNGRTASPIMKASRL